MEETAVLCCGWRLAFCLAPGRRKSGSPAWASAAKKSEMTAGHWQRAGAALHGRAGREKAKKGRGPACRKAEPRAQQALLQAPAGGPNGAGGKAGPFGEKRHFCPVPPGLCGRCYFQCFSCERHRSNWQRRSSSVPSFGAGMCLSRKSSKACFV